MPIKSRRYRKANKSRRTRKNKTTRRYKKKQMGGGEIKNEIDLEKSWDDKYIGYWEADDGAGSRIRVGRDGFKSSEELKKYLAYYLNNLKDLKNKDAFIRSIVA